MSIVARLLGHIARHVLDRESRRWLPTPTGCCTCGTGGPYYKGDAPQVTRYLYTGATSPETTIEPAQCDWSACSAHPVEGLPPVVDYGRDVVVTFAQSEADFRAVVGGAR